MEKRSVKGTFLVGGRGQQMKNEATPPALTQDEAAARSHPKSQQLGRTSQKPKADGTRVEATCHPPTMADAAGEV